MAPNCGRDLSVRQPLRCGNPTCNCKRCTECRKADQPRNPCTGEPISANSLDQQVNFIDYCTAGLSFICVTTVILILFWFIIAYYVVRFIVNIYNADRCTKKFILTIIGSILVLSVTTEIYDFLRRKCLFCNLRIPNPFKNIPNPFKNMTNPFEIIANFFKNLPNPFKIIANFFKNLPNPFKIIANFFKSLPNPFKIIGNFFESLPNPFKCIGKLFNNMPNPFIAIINLFKSIWNGFTLIITNPLAIIRWPKTNCNAKPPSSCGKPIPACKTRQRMAMAEPFGPIKF